MPPKQCPECGRFLKNALVVELTRGPAPCPKCEVELTAAMFGLEDAPSPAAEGATAAPPAGPAVMPAPSAAPLAGATVAPEVPVAEPAAPTSPAVAPSIRPPDLVPEAVRDRADPLAGWDVGAPLPEVRDERPFPTDTVVVLAGAVAGAVAGTLAVDHRGRGGALGALAGAFGAGILRRVWTLPQA